MRKRKATDDGVDQVSTPVKQWMFAPLAPPTPLVALLAKIGASLEAIPCPRIETELSKDALSSELSSGDQPATELEMEQMDASSRGGLVKVAASQPNQQTQPKRRSSALPWSILQAS
jgi:hypothetical protein